MSNNVCPPHLVVLDKSNIESKSGSTLKILSLYMDKYEFKSARIENFLFEHGQTWF